MRKFVIFAIVCLIISCTLNKKISYGFSEFQKGNYSEAVTYFENTDINIDASICEIQSLIYLNREKEAAAQIDSLICNGKWTVDQKLDYVRLLIWKGNFNTINTFIATRQEKNREYLLTGNTFLFLL
jgi:hypothetical protein